MATWTIASADFAGELESDLEGRLEIMKDDGLEASPDYVDMDSVANALRDIMAYPSTLTLSDGEAQQAYFSLENVVDFTDSDVAPFQTAMGELAAQGYPWGNTVFDLFRRRLGVAPNDATLGELPVASNCGDDCAKAINAAADFVAAIRKAYGDHDSRIADAIATANDVVECFWRG